MKELIGSLKNELREASLGAEDPMFTLDAATIKTRIAVVDKRSTAGGVEIYVASADVETARENTTEHEVTINLKGINGDLLLGSD
ncbi:hypothetical protein KBI52_28680 [Microvirga sp. HBU67558]|uniref:trypco2 family protein n=1 Tax=Microvirga TaxID=186650 RepID=UPI001B396EA6|nr:MULTISPECIES: trypco2 family protein [unclassified Microvirga]MBQ0824177.1 hypothetical protein [Microvirga sp. HBU67558]